MVKKQAKRKASSSKRVRKKAPKMPTLSAVEATAACKARGPDFPGPFAFVREFADNEHARCAMVLARATRGQVACESRCPYPGPPLNSEAELELNPVRTVE